MKFTAKRIDLAIEIETLKGETANHAVKVPLSAEAAAALLDRIITEENEFASARKTDDEASTYAAGMAFIDGQLSSIYETEPGYWSANLDRATLVDIKNHIVNELVGVRKN